MLMCVPPGEVQVVRHCITNLSDTKRSPPLSSRPHDHVLLVMLMMSYDGEEFYKRILVRSPPSGGLAGGQDGTADICGQDTADNIV